jgi:hypothetical protein
VSVPVISLPLIDPRWPYVKVTGPTTLDPTRLP